MALEKGVRLYPNTSSMISRKSARASAFSKSNLLIFNPAGHSVVLYTPLSMQGHKATSISSLDQKLDASVLGLNEDLHRTKAEIEKTTAEIAHQEEEISILRSSLEKAMTDARADRASRAREVAALQKRLGDLESRAGR